MADPEKNPIYKFDPPTCVLTHDLTPEQHAAVQRYADALRTESTPTSSAVEVAQRAADDERDACAELIEQEIKSCQHLGHDDYHLKVVLKWVRQRSSTAQPVKNP